ncbi:MAG TPA: FtsW/RodA/SpoVE family cell cycle protein [Chloroflexota bacterium]|jgi:cell division protein FtsW (lipid II flippase)|nr:FtsW/RodA/SpoVE family cell cycle protein [Chloroflexota bacterium]
MVAASSPSSLRWRELGLLLTGLLPCLVGTLLLSVVWERELNDARFYPVYAFAGLLLLSHFVLVARRFRGDQVLLPLTGAIAGVGMLLVTRLAPALAPRQLVWMVLGNVVMLAVAVGPWETRLLERYKYTSAIIGILLVAATLVFGIDPNGSGVRLWLGVRGLSFQPSEMLKVLLVIFLAGYLVDKRELLTTEQFRWGPVRLPPMPYLAPLLAMWGISLALLTWQRDLGAALLFFGVFLVMLYLAVGRVSYVVAGCGLFLAGGLLCYRLFSHVRLRVELWLNPWVDPLNRSYQIAQALYAAGSGGLFGAGLGQGYPLYIPAAHTDFPFIALAEEGGLAAALALLLLYALLVTRGLQVALQARLPFNQLLAAGLTAVLALQTVVIVGGNLKVIPLTGVTLPFVSYGGSSLLANFLIIGILLRMSHEEASRGASG